MCGEAAALVRFKAKDLSIKAVETTRTGSTLRGAGSTISSVGIVAVHRSFAVCFRSWSLLTLGCISMSHYLAAKVFSLTVTLSAFTYQFLILVLLIYSYALCYISAGIQV